MRETHSLGPARVTAGSCRNGTRFRSAPHRTASSSAKGLRARTHPAERRTYLLSCFVASSVVPGGFGRGRRTPIAIRRCSRLANGPSWPRDDPTRPQRIRLVLDLDIGHKKRSLRCKPPNSIPEIRILSEGAADDTAFLTIACSAEVRIGEGAKDESVGDLDASDVFRPYGSFFISHHADEVFFSRWSFLFARLEAPFAVAQARVELRKT